ALCVGGFIFVAWEMRPRAGAIPVTEEPAPEVDEARIIRAVGAPIEQPWSTAPAAGLAFAEAGAGDASFDSDDEPQREPSAAWRWLSGLVDRAPVRRDRSALLINESSGRLDRKDAALMLVVFVAALTLRTYRLEVPYGPHFDEVYHARTAVEFLQDWRYGMPHAIYEYTHPHMAKYLMAVGIAAFGNNRVTNTSDLQSGVKDAALEKRWDDPNQPNARNGDRLYVVTSQDVRVYDLATRAELARLPGFYAAVAIDQRGHTVYVADAAGAVSQLPTSPLDEARTTGGTAQLAAFPFAQLDGLNGSLQHLSIAGSSLIGVSDTSTLVSADLTTGVVTGTATLTSVSSVVSAGSRSMVFVDTAQVTDSAALASTLAGLLATDADPMQTAINSAAGGRVAVAGDIGNVVDGVQAAIDDGTVVGVSIENGDAVAVGTSTGLSLLDADTLASLREFTTTAPVTGMDLVSQGPEKPTIYAASGNELVTVRLPSDDVASLSAPVPMPNFVDKVLWNPATTNIHVLGRSQDGQADTIYVVEPRSNSVFADARLAFAPQVLLMDAMREWPSEDRDDVLALSAVGQMATVDVGNNQWAYRFPGVLLGALMAVLIYLLARFLFARRSIAIIAALLVLADGMFFANSRIAMNDIYVSFFIVAALAIFVPLWLGRWRSRPALVGGFLAIGVLLGLAFASKWVGLYAMGAVGLLILLRSALGRYIALLAMLGMTAVLGYIAITPPALVENPTVNYLFLFVMVALTALLAVGIALRPMRMSTEETRLAVLVALAPGPLVLVFGLLKLFAGGPPPILGTLLTPQRITLIGALLTAAGVVAIVALWFLRRRGIGPFSRTPVLAPNGEPASPPPPRGWLRPGSGFLGMSWVLALSAVLVIPLFIYTLSYIPWINLNNRWTADFPAGNGGQTFIDLQKGMYDYHNNLRATHPASSPWWAWPLDLKPVWFEQADYAGSTTAVIYDTGNLVIFWLAIPAVAWLAWMAWKRRSLRLAFVALMIASLWLPWARIDRAAFQYHIFTTLPFSFMALAYFLGELWHGPSARTWLLARIAAAVAIIGAPLLWLLRLPLCGIAQTEKVNAGSETCGALSRQLVLTDLQAVGLLLAVAGLVAAAVLVYASVRASPTAARSPVWPLLLPISFAVALFGVVIVTVGAGLPGNAVLQTTVRAEEPAFVALLLLAVPAYFVLRAADPRKFVIGALSAAVIWFVAFYPNIASLPVPTPLSQIHLGLLPTWNWGFQFAVNLDPANTSPISWSAIGLLAVAVIALCVAAVYAARSWYYARNSRDDLSALPETG
ncbi:MAG: phospholipid carrier-dependent glycosyltransferase, partial [Chloroflexota bacterium]